MGNDLVYICSPYRGAVERNVEYARQLTRTALESRLIPVVPHLYLTQVLDDERLQERQQGMEAGLELLKHCKYILIGCKYGISSGMKAEIREAQKLGKTILYTEGSRAIMKNGMAQQDPYWWFGLERKEDEQGAGSGEAEKD